MSGRSPVLRWRACRVTRAVSSQAGDRQRVPKLCRRRHGACGVGAQAATDHQFGVPGSAECQQRTSDGRGTNVDADWTAQLTELLDYRQWWLFQLEYRRSHDDGWTALNSKTHGALSGGEKAVCLHLPLFAAAATYCDSAGVRAVDVDGQDLPGCPRLIVLDEVFAGVDEDNRGALFDIVRTLDMDMVATSESEQGFYPQLDGVAVYHLVSSDALGCIRATRTIWDGSTAHQLLDGDLIDAP